MFATPVCGCTTSFGSALEPSDPFDEVFPVIASQDFISDEYQVILYDLYEYWKKIVTAIIVADKEDSDRHAWFDSKLENKDNRVITNFSPQAAGNSSEVKGVSQDIPWYRPQFTGDDGSKFQVIN